MAYKRKSKHRPREGHENNRNRQRHNTPKVNTKGNKPSHVTIVARPGEHPERTIKRFLKRCKKIKIVEEFRKRQYYEKPSVVKRREKLRRKRVIEKAEKDK
tara:strand:- start:25625 stop:25927 length:303 start_codon:yes stop_codon:yes gene_type:complete